MQMNHRRRDEIVKHIVKSQCSRALVKIIAATCILAIRQSSLRWHDSCSGFYTEHGKSFPDAKRKVQAGGTREAESSEAGKDDGWCCSSVEAFVMKVERRAPIIQLRTF
jgi:hypothetical protein